MFKRLYTGKLARRRTYMVMNAIPNLILVLFTLLSFASEIGWQKLLDFPYYILLVWLLYFGAISAWLRWDEPKEQDDERKDFIIELKKAIQEAVEPMNKSLRNLSIEKKVEDDRNNDNSNDNL